MYAMPGTITRAASLILTLGCSATLATEEYLVLPEERSANLELILDSQGYNLDIAPESVLQVFVGNQQQCCESKLPIAGQYRIAGSSITFDPVFDFVEGQRYTVKFNHLEAESPGSYELAEFSIANSVAEIKPEIVAIYPSGDFLPENTLRFYFHFSTAMTPHKAAEYIRLVDSNGKTDSAAFMTFKQELWSEDRKRLTLLIDPGRIKRGVAQNVTLGPALNEGHQYSIVIDEGWQSATGLPITEKFEKPVTISSALRTIPDTQNWHIRPVRTRSFDPLTIEFDRPYDYQLAQNSITILDQHGQIVSGSISMQNNEQRWQLVPDRAWTGGLIQVVVNPAFEDVSGNNFIDLLDHPLGKNPTDISQKRIVLKHNLLPG